MNIQTLATLYERHKSPALFENSKTQEDFWDNEHISKMMLLAHLNPDWDAASRKTKTIDETVAWLKRTLKYKAGDRLLDLGCGPGLYTSRFYKQGLDVVGIDYSRRSVAYAIAQAEQHHMAITYRYMNYLELDFVEAYELITLIYCDFGVLSPKLRSQLLKKIHQALKPGGYFIFDVWTEANDELNAQYKNWFIHETQGFWKPTPHLELINKQFFKEELVSLKQHLIVESDTVVSVYNLWEQCYTEASVSELLISHGFEVLSLTGDLTGTPYDKTSKMIGVVVRKV